MIEVYYIPECPFNLKNARDIVGLYFQNPPSYCAIEAVQWDGVARVYEDVREFRTERHFASV